MIQQILHINSWQALENLLSHHEKIPLFEAKADLFTSPSGKDFLTQPGKLSAKSTEIINQNFSQIFLSDSALSMADFLNDLSRLPINNNIHSCILLDLSQSSKLDVNFAIEQATIDFINVTILLLDVNNSLNLKEYTDYLRGKTVFLGELKQQKKQTFLKVTRYLDGDIQLGNKLFLLSDDDDDHIEKEVLPILVSSQATSRDFIHSHGFQVFEQFDFPQSILEANQASVVVLPCGSFDDIKRVAGIILHNKKRFGEGVHFVVKELKPCIRYNDFHMLITAGAQSIVEHNKSEAALYDQIRLASMTTMKAHYVSETSLFKQFESPVNDSGFVSYETFKSLTLDAINVCRNTQIEYALVELTPFSSVPLSEAISYSQMKRRGDIACQIDGRILIFFSSLRRYEIHQALLNVFAVAPSELFIEQFQYTDADKIMTRLSSIQGIDYSEQSNQADTVPEHKTPASRFASPADWDEL
ncbi:BcsE family c-di-GMP-binding protein [Vibrio sp. 10N]|uniref:BcsE family c-di-GMP-binding protein n=1 Tax=Vibrio sp. 10N TaxID=3058938 RepID=UPI0028141FCE|nr:hypothetical protein VB10N_26310 [Vibrio sp. 10N]